MPRTLQRITTEYDANEDRIRLCGDYGEGGPVVLWLTKRLLKKLIPVLTQWLEKRCAQKSHAAIRQRFTQQAVNTPHVAQSAVVASAGCEAWLVSAIDVVLTPQEIILTFRSHERDSAKLRLHEYHLRQWLNMLYQLFQQGGWEADVWPSWVIVQEAKQEARVVH